MANLKDLKSRITSITSTMQITNAMKLVSAAKLKKAQDAILQMRPYANKLQELLSNVSAGLEEGSVGGDYTKVKPSKKILLVAYTSNRGLCGGYNSSIVKEIKKLLNTDWAGKEVEIISIGKKARDAFKATPGFVIETNMELVDSSDYDEISSMAETLMDKFVKDEYDQIHLLYNQFKNAATQEVTQELLLPIQLKNEEGVSTSQEYIFEPNREEIVLDLIPKSIKTQMFKALLDSVASEQGARMTAMHKATDNADELRKELNLTYNQMRQAAITKEILEIVSGAEALAG